MIGWHGPKEERIHDLLADKEFARYTGSMMSSEDTQELEELQVELEEHQRRVFQETKSVPYIDLTGVYPRHRPEGWRIYTGMKILAADFS